MADGRFWVYKCLLNKNMQNDISKHLEAREETAEDCRRLDGTECPAWKFLENNPWLSSSLMHELPGSGEARTVWSFFKPSTFYSS